jgi:hypothetical protein
MRLSARDPVIFRLDRRDASPGCERAARWGKWACKPDSVSPCGAAAISLGRVLPRASVRCSSSGRAAQSRGTVRAILLRVGFTRARVTATLRELLPHDFTLARPRRKPRSGGMFLWHFPSGHPDRTLSCTLPCEARTFLTPRGARLPGALPLSLTVRGGEESPCRSMRAPVGGQSVAPANREVWPPWGHSSVGRASRWQREGQEFESPCLHQRPLDFTGVFLRRGQRLPFGCLRRKFSPRIRSSHAPFGVGRFAVAAQVELIMTNFVAEFCPPIGPIP